MSGIASAGLPGTGALCGNVDRRREWSQLRPPGVRVRWRTHVNDRSPNVCSSAKVGAGFGRNLNGSSPLSARWCQRPGSSKGWPDALTLATCVSETAMRTAHIGGPFVFWSNARRLAATRPPRTVWGTGIKCRVADLRESMVATGDRDCSYDASDEHAFDVSRTRRHCARQRGAWERAMASPAYRSTLSSQWCPLGRIEWTTRTLRQGASQPPAFRHS